MEPPHQNVYSYRVRLPGPEFGWVLQGTRKGNNGVLQYGFPYSVGGTKREDSWTQGGKAKDYVTRMLCSSEGNIYAPVAQVVGWSAFPYTIQSIKEHWEGHLERLHRVPDEVCGLDDKNAITLLIRECETQVLKAVAPYAESGLSSQAKHRQWLFNAAVIAIFVRMVVNTIGDDVLGPNRAFPDDMTELIRTTWTRDFQPFLHTTAEGTLANATAEDMRNVACLVLPGCLTCGAAGQTSFLCKGARAHTSPTFDAAFRAAVAQDPKLTKKAFGDSKEGKEANIKDRGSTTPGPSSYEGWLKSQLFIPVPIA